MTYTSYFLIVFVIWIIMEICRKSKVEYPYSLLMEKSNTPDIRDQDRGLRKWVGFGTVIVIVLLIIGTFWVYNVWNEPTQQELQIDRNHRKAVGY